MSSECSNTKTSSLVFGGGLLFGIFGLSFFYYLLLFAVTRDLRHPLSQFALLWPWMSALIIGFGIQIGLFRLLTKGFRFSLQEKSDAKFSAGTGSAVSGLAMVACCAHHAVELFPILGLSVAALFLSKYQEQLLVLGVITNFVGILMMLWFLTGKATPKIMINFILSKVRRFS